MGSRRRRLAASLTAFAAVALSIAGIITAGPASANAADPLPTTTGSATVAPNGDVTVNVSGTWLWATQQAGGNDGCGGHYGVGWAIAWGDPNQPGNLVSGHTTSGAPINLLVG
ncbi:MAG: hypothetical protein JO075_12830, partial [Acidimicrobiia bacterium]|nr:hypothetical protein [Acidimicrobiia bacterium]